MSFQDLVPGDFSNNIDKIMLEVEGTVLAQASDALADVNQDEKDDDGGGVVFDGQEENQQ